MSGAAPQLPIVELKQARVELDGHTILQNLSIAVYQGQVWQVHGPAGSGKSILLEVLAGRYRLASGSRSYPALAGDSPDAVIGIPPRFTVRLVSHQEQRRVALAQSSFYQARWHSLWTATTCVRDFLAPERVLGLYAYEHFECLPVRRDFAEERDRCLVETRLDQCATRTIGQLSNGELRKLLLIAAHLASPKLLLLDDPLGGLDPQSREAMREMIVRWCAAGQTLVCCSCHETELADVVTHHVRLAASEARQPDAPQPDAPQPDAPQPDAPQPDAPQPDAPQPDAPQPDAPQPDAPQPDARWWCRLAPFAEPLAVGSDTASLDRGPSRLTVAKLPARGEVISCRALCVKANDSVLLHGLDWDVHPGEHWLVTGPNGAGKSTLLAILMGDHPQAYSNDVLVFGQQLGFDTTLWHRRKVVGFVAPELSWHYPQGWRLLDVVSSGFGANIGLHRPIDAHERELALEWLRRFGLLDRALVPLSAVSEGTKYLTLVARAMVQQPRLLLLDEATQNVAARQRGILFRLLDELARSEPTTVVLVTHHMEERPNCITHHLALAGGSVRRQGPVVPEDVFSG